MAEPRIVHDMPEAEYHAHPALSSTGARLLLDSPRKFQWAQSNPQPYKAAFDVGTAVHSKVLGLGAETVAIPVELLASNGAASTTAAKQFIEQARLNGQTPVKKDVADEINAMAEALLAHPSAAALLEQQGIPEASVFGTDPDTGLELRARFDYLPTGTGTRVGVDVKTGRDASPKGWARAAADHGYHVQRGHYLDTFEYAGGIELDGFAFAVVESTAPYLVGVYRLNSDWEEIGVRRAREARDIYKRCLDTNTWPGYGDEVQSLLAPFWLIADYQETLDD